MCACAKSMGPALKKRASTSPAPLAIPAVCNKRFATTERWKTASIGCWTSPFGRTRAVSARAMATRTSASYAVWPSISCVMITLSKQASRPDATGLAGMRATCSRSFRSKYDCPATHPSPACGGGRRGCIIAVCKGCGRRNLWAYQTHLGK